MRNKKNQKPKDVVKKPQENVKKENVISKTVANIKEGIEKKKSNKFATFRQKLTKPFNKDSVFNTVVRESLKSVMPIALIVAVLCFTFLPISNNTMMAFAIGTVLLIIGMGLFNMGAETALTPLGENVGKSLTSKSKNIWLVGLMGFVIGLVITVAEPDLQVLANQVSSFPNLVLIGTVAIGVAIFLVIALLRIIFGVPLRIILIAFYAVVFILAAFVPSEFWAVAFDSGGVTTGPMTVPFIIALGVGVSSLKRGKQAEDDSFGLVSLCSVGPIIAVMVLGLIYNTSGLEYTPDPIPDPQNTQELFLLYIKSIPNYLKEMSISLAPILVFLIGFQLSTRKLNKKEFARIIIGLLYTLVGLTIFLTGANVGFMPVGRLLGAKIASFSQNWLLIPIAMLIGFFIVQAEPAVHVLNKQVEEITLGKIPAKAMNVSLSIGIAVSLALAMVRVLTGVSIMWFVAPMYGISLVLAFFVPKVFTAIAFDSGGVASGPMTAAFLMPLSIGACMALHGDASHVFTDAFGVVAMVAAAPLLTIQILGLVYKIKSSKPVVAPAPVSVGDVAEPVRVAAFVDGVIELD